MFRRTIRRTTRPAAGLALALVLLTSNAVFGTSYLQPLGALLGVAWLGEAATAFTAAGGTLILTGLWLALTGRAAVA